MLYGILSKIIFWSNFFLVKWISDSITSTLLLRMNILISFMCCVVHAISIPCYYFKSLGHYNVIIIEAVNLFNIKSSFSKRSFTIFFYFRIYSYTTFCISVLFCLTTSCRGGFYWLNIWIKSWFDLIQTTHCLANGVGEFIAFC